MENTPAPPRAVKVPKLCLRQCGDRGLSIPAAWADARTQRQMVIVVGAVRSRSPTRGEVSRADSYACMVGNAGPAETILRQLSHDSGDGCDGCDGDITSTLR